MLDTNDHALQMSTVWRAFRKKKNTLWETLFPIIYTPLVQHMEVTAPDTTLW